MCFYRKVHLQLYNIQQWERTHLIKVGLLCSNKPTPELVLKYTYKTYTKYVCAHPRKGCTLSLRTEYIQVQTSEAKSLTSLWSLKNQSQWHVHHTGDKGQSQCVPLTLSNIPSWFYPKSIETRSTTNSDLVSHLLINVFVLPYFLNHKIKTNLCYNK